MNDPRSVLELALSSREFESVSSRLDANSFVLKVVGKEEYFLKEVPIIQYKVHVCVCDCVCVTVCVYMHVYMHGYVHAYVHVSVCTGY